jgi:hypothetical protein
MIEARQGRFVPQRLVACRLGVTVGGVTFPRTAKHLCQSGYRIELSGRPRWRDLRRALRGGASVILSVRCSILWQDGEFGHHAVLLVSVGPKNCLIFDPDRKRGGWRRIGKRQLRRAMSGDLFQALIVSSGAG